MLSSVDLEELCQENNAIRIIEHVNDFSDFIACNYGVNNNM